MPEQKLGRGIPAPQQPLQKLSLLQVLEMVSIVLSFALWVYLPFYYFCLYFLAIKFLEISKIPQAKWWNLEERNYQENLVNTIKRKEERFGEVLLCMRSWLDLGRLIVFKGREEGWKRKGRELIDDARRLKMKGYRI